MNRLRRRLIEKRLAARDGKRFSAFYCGVRDFRVGQNSNPFESGSVEAVAWDAGRQYAQLRRAEDTTSPVCRFGPGGDFVRNWPQEET